MTPLHPLVAAKTALEASDWALSNLPLNKILYLAHMISLGKYGVPLVSENFEAWDYGPVLPTVYHEAKVFGSDPIRDIFFGVPSAEPASEARDLIASVVDATKNKTPGELVAFTHWENGAWAKYYRPGVRGIVIPNDDILEEYRERTIKK